MSGHERTPGERETLPAAAFSFPLNVYARLLELEEGRAEYLHYGLFETDEGSAAAAQRRASALLWQHLPAPCKLLDVGLGLGTTLQQLLAAGHEALGITPDSQQIAFARARHGADLPVLAQRFEDFDHEAGRWQAILFQESAQYIDAVDLFARASQLLTGDGEILIMDEFVLRHEDEQTHNLHQLDHVLQLAGRFGFELVTRCDLSRQAAPTVDWLLAAARRHAAQLQHELGVSNEQLQRLEASNQAYRRYYASGCYGYFLLRFRRRRQPRWLPERLDATRQEEMRALFARTFGQTMSAAHWQWKYGAGRGLGIGVWQQAPAAGDLEDAGHASAPATRAGERRLVAHYGGISRDILYLGRPARALQCVDVMVADVGRGTLARRGPLFLATATCLEQEIGYGTRHLVGFGFPNRRAYQLPARLGLYAEVGRLVEVRWPALAQRPNWRVKVRPLPLEHSAAEAQMSACWAAMRESLTGHIVGVRDAAYLRHRYLEHPDKSYQLHVVQRRFGGTALGLLVLHVTQEPGSHERSAELVDVVCALDRLPLMLHQARRIAATQGCQRLFAWVVDNLLPALALPAQAEVTDLHIQIPANLWSPGPAIEEQRGKWWLTGGDTDFR